MIKPETAAWFEMNEAAIEELLLLMSLWDLNAKAAGHDLLTTIQDRRYYRRPSSSLTYSLSYSLPESGYVERHERMNHLKRKGEVRLRDLCELVHATPSAAPQLTPEAFARIKQVRGELGLYPFTNGRSAEKNQIERRSARGYKLYIVLLHETALQRWYRIKNSSRNSKLPCLYIGVTKKSVLDRFDEHRFEQNRASTYVYHHGLCLVPMLYSRLNRPLSTWQKALAEERRLADHLRWHGFAVFAGHHDREARPRKRGTVR